MSSTYTLCPSLQGILLISKHFASFIIITIRKGKIRVRAIGIEAIWGNWNWGNRHKLQQQHRNITPIITVIHNVVDAKDTNCIGDDNGGNRHKTNDLDISGSHSILENHTNHPKYPLFFFLFWSKSINNNHLGYFSGSDVFCFSISFSSSITYVAPILGMKVN